MKKYLWRIYYLFAAPTTKSGIMVRYARCNGHEVHNIKLSTSGSFSGVPVEISVNRVDNVLIENGFPRQLSPTVWSAKTKASS
jgi:hypothetical protein